MTAKWLVSMLGAAAMAVSAGAFAQKPPDTGFYLGAEAGSADVGRDDNDIGFKILGGYRFNTHFGAELGYGLLYDKDNVEVTALEAVAVGLLPLGNRFSLLGKLGLASVEVETPGGSNDKSELTWGIGAQYDIGRNLGLRAVWQRYETDDSADVLAVGVTFLF